MAGLMAVSTPVGAKTKPPFRNACALLTRGQVTLLMGRPPIKIGPPVHEGEVRGCHWLTFDHAPVSESDSTLPENIVIGVDTWRSLKQAKIYMSLGADGNQCEPLLNRIGDQAYECAEDTVTFRLGRRVVTVNSFRNSDRGPTRLVRTVKTAVRVEHRLARYSAAN